MNPTDPLANLRDIHLPGEVSWWPLAPGWWILFVVIIGLSLWGLYRWRKQQQRLVLVKEVETELNSIKQQFAEHNTSRQLVSDYSQLLRRLLVLHKGRQFAANLTGEQWIDCLRDYLPDQPLEQSILDLLVYGKYQKQTQLESPDQLIQWVQDCAIAISRQIISGKANA